MDARKASTLSRRRVMNPLIWIRKEAIGVKKNEKTEAARLRGTIRNPTHGMMKRLVKNPMGEKRLKWKATNGAVPKMATPVTRRGRVTYFKRFFFQEVSRRREIPFLLNC